MIMKKLILVGFMLLTTGCAGLMGEPCEDKWTKTYTAKGQVLYVLEESRCVSVQLKDK